MIITKCNECNKYNNLTCKRCGNEWTPRSEVLPKRCSRCMSCYWNMERIVKKESIVATPVVEQTPLEENKPDAAIQNEARPKMIAAIAGKSPTDLPKPEIVAPEYGVERFKERMAEKAEANIEQTSGEQKKETGLTAEQEDFLIKYTQADSFSKGALVDKARSEFGTEWVREYLS